MISSFVTILVISMLAHVLFQKRVLSLKWDFLRCYQRTNESRGSISQISYNLVRTTISSCDNTRVSYNVRRQESKDAVTIQQRSFSKSEDHSNNGFVVSSVSEKLHKGEGGDGDITKLWCLISVIYLYRYQLNLKFCLGAKLCLYLWLNFVQELLNP